MNNFGIENDQESKSCLLWSTYIHVAFTPPFGFSQQKKTWKPYDFLHFGFMQSTSNMLEQLQGNWYFVCLEREGLYLIYTELTPLWLWTDDFILPRVKKARPLVILFGYLYELSSPRMYIFSVPEVCMLTSFYTEEASALLSLNRW